MSTSYLNQAILASLAGIGGIFTDAVECKASVAAAENLVTFAKMVAANAPASVTTGDLFADGELVTQVTVHIDGRLTVSVPEGFDTSGHRWTASILGETIPVDFFAGECSDDETWVIGDADAFYTRLLKG